MLETEKYVVDIECSRKAGRKCPDSASEHCLHRTSSSFAVSSSSCPSSISSDSQQSTNYIKLFFLRKKKKPSLFGQIEVFSRRCSMLPNVLAFIVGYRRQSHQTNYHGRFSVYMGPPSSWRTYKSRSLLRYRPLTFLFFFLSGIPISFLFSLQDYYFT